MGWIWRVTHCSSCSLSHSTWWLLWAQTDYQAKSLLLSHGHAAGCESLHFKYRSAVTTWFIITIATNTKTSRNLIKSRDPGFIRKLSSDLRQSFSHDFLSFFMYGIESTFTCTQTWVALFGLHQSLNTWPTHPAKASSCCLCVCQESDAGHSLEGLKTSLEWSAYSVGHSPSFFPHYWGQGAKDKARDGLLAPQQSSVAGKGCGPLFSPFPLCIHQPWWERDKETGRWSEREEWTPGTTVVKDLGQTIKSIGENNGTSLIFF